MREALDVLESNCTVRIVVHSGCTWSFRGRVESNLEPVSFERSVEGPEGELLDDLVIDPSSGELIGTGRVVPGSYKIRFALRGKTTTPVTMQAEFAMEPPPPLDGVVETSGLPISK